MVDCNCLDTLRQTDIETIDKSELVNIQDVKIDTDLPAPARMLRYLEQIKNPYCFLCGEIPVKISFSSDGDELSELLKRYFITLKR